MLPIIDDWRDERLLPVARPLFGDNDNAPHPYRTIPPVVAAPANENRRCWIERDSDGNAIRVVRAERVNPLLCRPNNIPPKVAAAPRPASDAVERRAIEAQMERIAVRQRWKLTAPKNDSDIFPRKPRNAGAHPDLAAFLPELRFWRLMSSPLDTWAPVVPATENEAPLAPEGENPEIRPTENDLRRCLPTWPWRVGLPRGLRALADHMGDIKIRDRRIARLGGLRFAVAERADPDDCDGSSNISGPVTRMPYAGTLVGYRLPGTTYWAKPSEASRERRAGNASTSGNSRYRQLLGEPLASLPRPRLPTSRRRKPAAPDSPIIGPRPPVKHCPLGLPWQPAQLGQLFVGMRVAAKAGTHDGSGEFERVQGAAEAVRGDAERMADAGTIARFRDVHPDRAGVLDAVMVAANMNEVAATVGKSSPHSGKRAVVAACRALRDFSIKEAA